MYQSCEQLHLTPKNVVIVVISLPQKELRMTTFSRVKIALKQLLSPSALANDDVVKLDARPSGPKGQNYNAQGNVDVRGVMLGSKRAPTM